MLFVKIQKKYEIVILNDSIHKEKVPWLQIIEDILNFAHPE